MNGSEVTQQTLVGLVTAATWWMLYFWISYGTHFFNGRKVNSDV